MATWTFEITVSIYLYKAMLCILSSLRQGNSLPRALLKNRYWYEAGWCQTVRSWPEGQTNYFWEKSWKLFRGLGTWCSTIGSNWRSLVPGGEQEKVQGIPAGNWSAAVLTGSWPAYFGASCEVFTTVVSGVDLTLEVSVGLKALGCTYLKCAIYV